MGTGRMYRIHPNPHYPKIATKIMFDLMAEKGEAGYYNFCKYDIHNFEGDATLKKIADDLLAQTLNWNPLPFLPQ